MPAGPTMEKTMLARPTLERLMRDTSATHDTRKESTRQVRRSEVHPKCGQQTLVWKILGILCRRLTRWRDHAGESHDGEDHAGNLHDGGNHAGESHDGARHVGGTTPESPTLEKTVPESPTMGKTMQESPTIPRWSRACRRDPRYRDSYWTFTLSEDAR